MKAMISLFAFIVLSATAVCHERNNDTSAKLTSMIEELSQLKQQSAVQEQSAFETAVDHLTWLRDHGDWPLINSPIAITSMQNTNWKMAADGDGFQQRISFQFIWPMVEESTLAPLFVHLAY